MAEYYIETGKPSSALLGAMGDKLCKRLEAANDVNTGTSIVALLAESSASARNRS